MQISGRPYQQARAGARSAPQDFTSSPLSVVLEALRKNLPVFDTRPGGLVSAELLLAPLTRAAQVLRRSAHAALRRAGDNALSHLLVYSHGSHSSNHPAFYTAVAPGHLDAAGAAEVAEKQLLPLVAGRADDVTRMCQSWPADISNEDLDRHKDKARRCRLTSG